MGEIRHAKTCSLGATTEANVKLNKCCAATYLYRLNSSSSTTALCPKYQVRLRTPTYIATCLKFGQPLISHGNDSSDVDHGTIVLIPASISTTECVCLRPVKLASRRVALISSRTNLCAGAGLESKMIVHIIAPSRAKQSQVKPVGALSGHIKKAGF